MDAIPIISIILFVSVMVNLILLSKNQRLKVETRYQNARIGELAKELRKLRGY